MRYFKRSSLASVLLSALIFGACDNGPDADLRDGFENKRKNKTDEAPVRPDTVRPPVNNDSMIADTGDRAAL